MRPTLWEYCLTLRRLRRTPGCRVMILPSKHLSQDRALLTVGAVILRHLSHPVTVSALWEQISRSARDQKASSSLRYDAFVLERLQNGSRFI